MIARGGPQVLVVEDEAHIRAFLRVCLQAHGFDVGERRTAAEGIGACAELRPELVILDLGLPDLDGVEVIRRVREWSDVPIIVLSARADEADKVDALDAGANDYVTKPFGIAELMARVRAALRGRGESEEPLAVFRTGALEVDRAMRRVRVGDADVALSPKEYALLALLVSTPGRVLTHGAILRDVWGPERVGETHHLRVLVGHLRRKLGDSPSRPRYVETVPGVGYRLRVED